MREILFRGKRVDNGEWVYGFYWFVEECRDSILSKSYFIESNGNNYEVIAETVGQFTGLLDKNGTKIFEGDIFEYGYVATWVDESSNGSHGMFAGWYLQRDDFESWEELSVGYSYEVIGNIHERTNK